MALKPRYPKTVRFPGVWSSIKMEYSPEICASYAERENYLDSRNPRRVKIEHKLQERPRDRLYWDFIAHTSKSKLPLPCLRVYYKRRWSNAFHEALKKNGFDFNGRPLPAERESARVSGLTGTLEMRLYDAPLWESNDHEGMLQQSDKIVKGLINFLSVVKRPIIRTVRT